MCSPSKDPVRVSFAVEIDEVRPKTVKVNSREWYQKLLLKRWRGISHQIDDPLRVLATQSSGRLKNGEGDVDLERRQMIAARIEAMRVVMPATTEEQQAHMSFRSKEHEFLLRKRSRMEAALREATAGRGISLIQLMCMHDLGLTTPLRLSQQDEGFWWIRNIGVHC